MELLLEKTQSSYYPAFKELFKETSDALEEAQDIDAHLKPLAGHFESLDTAEFDEAIANFDPMFHTICLLWAHSRYFCRPTRMIVLLQELVNMILKKASEYLEPIDLFKNEPEESIDKIKKTLNTLEAFQKSYESHRIKVLSYFKNGIPPREWEFTSKLVFSRWDDFIERINMIRVLLKC
jgi:dynein heavy chain, axonemal